MSCDDETSLVITKLERGMTLANSYIMMRKTTQTSSQIKQMPTDTEVDTDKDTDIRMILSTNATSHTHYVLHDNTLSK